MSIADITRNCAASHAGIKTLKLILAADIDIMPDPVNQEISNDIQLKTGKAFILIDIKQDNGSFEEAINLNKQGVVYEPTVNATISRTNLAALQSLSAFMFRDVVAWITDEEGNERIIGSKDQPVRISYRENLQERINQANFYDIEITKQRTEPTPYFTGSVV